MQDIFFFAPWN